MSDDQRATATEPEEKKKGFEFPGTMTVLVIVTFIVWLAAFLIPAGTYKHDENGVPVPGSYTQVDSPQDFGERVGDFFKAPVNGLYGLQDPETGFVAGTMTFGRPLIPWPSPVNSGAKQAALLVQYVLAGVV